MKQKVLIHPLLLVTLSLLFVLAQNAEAGKLRRLVYLGYPGGLISDLNNTNSSGVRTFPDAPDQAEDIPAGIAGINTAPNPPFLLTTGEAYNDYYGSWIRGFITAPETGDYTFWLSTDDEGLFFMTTDPADPLNPSKTNLLCSVPGYSSLNQWNKFPEQQSPPVALEAGKTYYLEIFHKEGSGGDRIQIGWQTPSGLVQQPMPAWHYQPIRDIRWGDNDVMVFGGPVTPRDTFDPGVYDGMNAIVYANINLEMPVTYQWTRNSQIIPGATKAYYLFNAKPEDNNSTWSVTVTSGGQNYTPQTPYTLSVWGDSDKPTVISAGIVPGNPTRVQVVFSEEVNAQSANTLANYELPGATLSSPTLQPDGRTVLIDTTLLTPDRAWALTVRNITDNSSLANMMDPATTTLIWGEGGLSLRLYNYSVADLNALRNFQTNSVYVSEQYLEERFITSTTVGWPIRSMRNNYVGQVIGYVTAPETGDYVFGISSDDHSILFLGTDHQRSSKREVARCTGSTGQYNMGQYGTNQVTSNIRLEAGRRYYIEAIWRDGTGGDGVTVCWKWPSIDMFSTANASTAANITPYLINATNLSPYVAYSPVTFTTDLPTTLTAAESTAPVLRVEVDGLLPYGYQWYKNDTAIQGATASSYTVPFLKQGDNGAKFKVVASNNFSSAESAVCTVSVTGDTTMPSFESVGSLYKGAVEVRFAEPVTTATAGDKANYTLLTSAAAPVTINSVTVDPNDATHVTLQTAAMPDSDLMTLTAQNIADQSVAGNIMTATTASFRANNFDGAVRINNSQPWSVSAEGERIFMTAGGSDIWGTADQCAFVYKTVTGNFDYKIRGISLQQIDQWCKMGIMARLTTAANSRNQFIAFTPLTPSQNTYTEQVRTNAGTSTVSVDASGPLLYNIQGGVAQRPTISYPSWIRLQRVGDFFYWYYATDTAGTNWVFWTWYDSNFTDPFGAEGGPLPQTLQLGLALTSHQTGLTADGVMESFSPVTDGPLALGLQPTNTTALEGANAVFRVTATGTGAYFYQWLKNDQAIQDATNALCTLTRVSYNDNNARISVRVTNVYGTSVTSTNALLTVVQDTIRPTVAYYTTPKVNIMTNEVKLIFSEPVDVQSATTLGNYEITAVGGAALGLGSVQLDTDERTVIIGTADQVPGTTYRVTVNNVTDQACCPANAVAPNSSDFYFFAGAADRYAQRADGYVIMEAENAQRFVTGTTPARDWTMTNMPSGYSGLGAMNVATVGSTTGGTTPISGGTAQGTGPVMEFDIIFTRPTTNYTIWIRGANAMDGQPAGNNDSIFVGFDGNLRSVGPAGSQSVDYSQMSGFSANWDWRSDTSSAGDPMVLTNVAPGTHTFHIWQREDGTVIDKIVLEPGVRSGVGNTAEPTTASSNGGKGDLETWDFVVPPPAAPAIAIVSPTQWQFFPNGSTITIEASITAVSPLTLVEFFYGGTNLIGTASDSPYVVDWPNVPEGIYQVTARVSDVLGYQVTSAAVTVAVDSGKPVAYTVGSLGGTGIGVYFSDTTGLGAVSATNVSNYTVNGGAVTVTGATLEADNRAVMLELSAPISGTFAVTIKNVLDAAGPPNMMDTTTLESTVVTWPLQTALSGTYNNEPDPLLPGFVQAIGTDGFYVRAGGHDIWDSSDGAHFVYLPLTGDFDVSTRVTSLGRPNEWSKAGLMIREDLTGGSRNLMFLTAPTNGQNLLNVQWRLWANNASASLATASRVTPSPIPNCWMRLTRTNDVYTFLWGTNGVDWAQIHQITTNFPTTAYVGLATTSHSNSTNASSLTWAYYRDVTGFAVAPSESPALAAAVNASGEIVLAWISSNPAFELQWADGLVSPNWQKVQIVPVVNGNNYSVAVPITGTGQFFRLQLK